MRNKIITVIITQLIQLKSIALNAVCRIRYALVIRRIKKNANKRKINILFLVNEIAKWKGQCLYNILESDKHFNPIIGLTCADIDWTLSKNERIKKRENLKIFFSGRKMRFIEVCDAVSFSAVDLKKVNADIVFYQQPWNLHKKQKPQYLSRNHLTCYFPYYVPNYSSLNTDCQQGFHFLLWRYYHLSNDWVQTITKFIPQFMRSVRLVASGHPMLDYINKPKFTADLNKKKIIYAPHWSVYSKEWNNAERYSTFQHNGKEILEFAKRHPEFNWTFRPHPTLKVSLLRTNLWTEHEIDEYYREWEKIGEISNGDYVELFWNSSALITDCGSFLVEYACTKKPIIRLVSSVCGMSTPDPSKALFNSYYNVHNLKEMYDAFDLVLVKSLDPKREERINAVAKAGLLEVSASRNIVVDLYESIGLS